MASKMAKFGICGKIFFDKVYTFDKRKKVEAKSFETVLSRRH